MPRILQLLHLVYGKMPESNMSVLLRFPSIVDRVTRREKRKATSIGLPVNGDVVLMRAKRHVGIVANPVLYEDMPHIIAMWREMYSVDRFWDIPVEDRPIIKTPTTEEAK